MVHHHNTKKPVSKSKTSEKIGLDITSLLHAAKELKTKMAKKQHAS